MYGPMSTNRNFYGKHPFVNSMGSFVNPNTRQHSIPQMQRINGVHPKPLDSYGNPQMVFAPYTHGYNPYFVQPAQGFYQQPMEQQLHHTTSKPSYSQMVFQNPLFSPDENHPQHSQTAFQDQQPYFHPYPKASFLAKPPTGVQTVLNSFKSQDGTLDINKMVDTAGQMMNAVSQVSSVVKGIGGIFKV